MGLCLHRMLESKLVEAKSKKDTLKARAKTAQTSRQIADMVQVGSKCIHAPCSANANCTPVCTYSRWRAGDLRRELSDLPASGGVLSTYRAKCTDQPCQSLCDALFLLPSVEEVRSV